MAYGQQPSIGGFNGGAGFTANGGATFNGDTLTITDNHLSEARSVFYNIKQPVQMFSAEFTYSATNGTPFMADGGAFVIQDDPAGANALGAIGGSLGYAGLGGGPGISPSVALEFNVFAGHVLGIQVATNGSVFNYISTAPVDLTSGAAIDVKILYSNGDMNVVLTQNGSIFVHDFMVDIPSILGQGQAFVGFTGATGGLGGGTVVQTISSFTYSPQMSLAITGPSSLPNGTEGVFFGPVTFDATGGSGGKTWSAPVLPGGLQMSTDGVLSGTPAAGTSGSYVISVTVSDVSGNQANKFYNLLIQAPSPNPCVLSPGNASFGTGASNGNTVTITAFNGSCGSWMASSPANWIVIIGGASGSGNGTVTYNILANPNSALRSATLTIAGQMFMVTQAGQGCLLGLTPSNASKGVNGGNDSFNVLLSGADCSWTTNSNAPWAPITAGGSGTGNGTVSYTVLGNQSSNFSRTGTISVFSVDSQASFVITEAGTNCSYSLPRASQTFTSGGGTGTATVASQGGCSWTAAHGTTPFVTITGGTSGSGDGVVTYTVPANQSPTPRVETLTIAGQPYTVIQEGAQGASCTASVSGTPSAVAIEGRAELLTDLSINCTGLNGRPATIALTLNTNVTNTLTGTDTLDALLVNGNNSLNGHIAGYNTILWKSVMIGPAASFRITGVRADASLLGTGANLRPTAVTGQVSVNTGTDVPVSYTSQASACGVSSAETEILACASPMLVFQKGQPSSFSGGTQTIIPLVYQEASAGVFHSGGTAPTRLRLTISQVPATVRVFAPVYPSEGQGFAQLYSADANGAGGAPVTGISSLAGIYRELTITGGTTTATWVVLATVPNQIETWTFPLLLNNATNSDLNNIRIAATLAPISDVSVASATAPVPRYRDLSVPQKLVNLRITISTTARTATSTVMASLARGVDENPFATTVNGNVTSTIQILNDTSDPTQTATNVMVKGNVSGASIVGCVASGSSQCTVSGGTTSASYSSLGAGETQTVTVTEQSDPTVGVVDNTGYVGADQADADLTATIADSYTNLGAGPVAVTSQPTTGSGSSQSFTFVFSHPAGWQNLGVVNILINNSLDGRHACYLAYSIPSSILYLVDDAGDAGGPFAGSVALGNSTSIQNSQCAVSLTSALGSGTNFTLILNVTFKPAFGGNRITYTAAGDQSVGNSNWQALGVWQVPPPPTGIITAANINPGRTAGSTGTLQVTLTDTKGAGDIGIVNVLINNAIDGRHACYLAYAPSSNTLYLVDDAGDAGGPFAGSMSLTGGSSTIQNGQCQVNAFGSSAQASGSNLTLSLNLAFYAGFDGNRIIYVAGRDQAGGNNTDWQAVGTWTVQ
jgi:hypothetical protein